MGELMKGKPVADKIKEDIQKEVSKLKQKGIDPCMALIRIGEKPDDIYYERNILKVCEKLGIANKIFHLGKEITNLEMEKTIKDLNEDTKVHGIMMFAPLPAGLNERRIKNMICAEKDIDGLSLKSAGKVFAGEKDGFAPCTPSAVMEVLDHYNVDLSGKQVVVLGRSMVVGKPLAMLLLNRNATVTIAHSQTKDLANCCTQADILVAAVGRAKMVDEHFVNSKQLVIDVGINQDPADSSKICGDVDAERVTDQVAGITPVPGGVGSVTTAVLCKHLLRACKNLNNLL